MQYLELLDMGLVQLQIFLLAFARITAIFMTAPILGSRNTPMMTKAGFAFLVTFIVFPILDRNMVMPREALNYGFLVAQQIIVGVIIGYASNIIFAAIQMAGQIIDLQMGFGIVNVIDPISNSQVSIMGQFQFILGMLIFMAINGHHLLFQAVVESFRIAPMLRVGITADTAEKLVSIFYQIFVVAFKIAGPATLALFLTNVTLGFVARTIPQMNVFIVGLPLNIIVGIASVMIALPVVVNMFNTLLTDMWTDIYYLIASMRV
ncbi:MAG: flagellar type III secretion system protein FliR [Spirochaetia bacterium]|nr:flagellar type III secretion system protein FliR [Spirochaetia bacterium]